MKYNYNLVEMTPEIYKEIDYRIRDAEYKEYNYNIESNTITIEIWNESHHNGNIYDDYRYDILVPWWFNDAIFNMLRNTAENNLTQINKNIKNVFYALLDTNKKLGV